MERRATQKRPAAAIADAAPDPLQQRQQPDWISACPGPPEADWPRHLTESLKTSLAKLPDELVINIWSDCCGLVVEHAAALQMAGALSDVLGKKLTPQLYFACDKRPSVKKFVLQNYSPKHNVSDIMNRGLERGTYDCEVSGRRETIPQGIDIYGCCF